MYVFYTLDSTKIFYFFKVKENCILGSQSQKIVYFN